MTTVLLFAEHELSEREVTGTLEALAELRVDAEVQVDVTVRRHRPRNSPGCQARVASPEAQCGSAGP